MDVFITAISAFLPNEPVDNDAMETVLGKVDSLPSKARRIVLRNNQIKRRFYAIDPETGRMTHTNAQLTAEAVRRLPLPEKMTLDDLECLCCGTSTPDMIMPGHALMVLGDLGIGPLDAISTAGICMSGGAALKHAWMNVACGQSKNAVATGSELPSSFLRAGFLNPLFPDEADLEEKPARAFDADFLRWMLSDGAGAVLLSDAPNKDGLSLRIDWMDHLSFAGELSTCMYCGGAKDEENGEVTPWRDAERFPAELRPYRFSIRQDIRLLDREIVRTMGETLRRAADKRNLKSEDVDWFLPHYSSAYFRPKFHDEMERIGFPMPYEKWFTNLSETGNTGAAAIFIILEELFYSGKLEAGQKILCFIPESGRFSHCFAGMTVVEGAEKLPDL